MNGHFRKCASLSQRLVTLIQTPGTRQSVRVPPYSGPGTWPVHRLPFLHYPGPISHVQQTHTKRYMRLWLRENSDFLGSETPDSSRWCRFIKINGQRLKWKEPKKNQPVLASRPGAISMCFPLVALASSNIRKERLVTGWEPSAWFGFLIRQKWREDGAREQG